MAPFDLVIVGGGPAGLSTALHLAAHAPGLAERTLVLEKERYPREKICAGAIGARGLRALARIGVHVDVPHATIHGMSFGMAGDRWTTWEEEIGVVVRRVEFDHALAREVVRRGVAIEEGVRVDGVGPTLDGVRLITSRGVIEARAVVGADGVGGVVRRSAGLARAARRAQAIEVDTERVAGDPTSSVHFEFGAADLNGYAWDFPTVVGGQARVCRGVYRVLDGRPDDLRARLRSHLAQKGLELGRYPVRAFAEQGYARRAPIARPRILLAGEAAGIDILSGEGIAQALQYGALVAPFLSEAFGAGDLSFAGWTGHVRASQLGRQLLRRLFYYRLFYNSARPAMERIVRGIPSAVRMGLQDFAGKPIRGWSAFAREVVPAVVRHGPLAVVLAARGGGGVVPGS